MHDNNKRYKFKVIVVGEMEAGKTALVRRIIGEGFYSDYRPTRGVDFSCLQRDSMMLHLWELSGDKVFKNISRSFYDINTSIIVYVLDSTKEIEENKRIFQAFNKEITSKLPASDRLQLIIFNKSDDKDSKLSQAYINEFDTFNVSTLVCSAKENKGVDEIKDKCFSYVIKKAGEESLISEIEEYGKLLGKKHSQIAKNKATALEAIAKACRAEGMGKGDLSTKQIAKIRNIMIKEKVTINQHRHWSAFNGFFNLIDAVSSSTLERRITSNRLLNKLDTYLEHSTNEPSSGLKP